MQCTEAADKTSALYTDVRRCTGTRRGQKPLFPVDVLVVTHTHPGVGRSVLLGLVRVTSTDFNEGGGGFCFDGVGLRCSPDCCPQSSGGPVGHIPLDCYYDIFSNFRQFIYTRMQKIHCRVLTDAPICATDAHHTGDCFPFRRVAQRSTGHPCPPTWQLRGGLSPPRVLLLN